MIHILSCTQQVRREERQKEKNKIDNIDIQPERITAEDIIYNLIQIVTGRSKQAAPVGKGQERQRIM